MQLTLVILAAGLGSRYGGDKPMALVGPEGQSLFEYSVYDAYKVGFRHVVFVVNAHQDTTEFSERLQYYDDLKIDFVVQALTAFVEPAGIQHSLVREKPWGTAHAVLVCKDHIQNPFVVINADDYYGRENYKNIGQYLLTHYPNPKTCVLPGYRLDNTLSSSGGVNRGICEIGSDGFLDSINEIKNIFTDQSMLLQFDESDIQVTVENDSIASMTFWGFMPSIFKFIESEFQKFLTESTNLEQDEFYIPDTVNQGIQLEWLRVKMLNTSETWKGLTYSDDLMSVKQYILKLTESGLYSDLGDA